MGKKLKVLIPLAVLAVAGYFGFIQLRFFLYTMKVREDVDKSTGRFPTVKDLVGLKGVLKDTAERSHIPLETWKETTKVEGRNQGPIRMYYVVVTVKDGPRTFTYGDHRIESDALIVTEAAMAELKEQDIDVEK